MHHLHRDILLVAAALLVVACSSDSTLEEKREHAPLVDDQKPMVFSSSSAKTAATRASSALETLHNNFKVSVWKNYGNTASQQNVMDGYKVNYTASKWDYVDVVVGTNTQAQRYWDMNAYPYEFRATSPYLPGALLATDKITLDVSSQPFKAQTLINDAYNATDVVSEPCIVAHVNRQKVGDDYVDMDVIANEEINTASKINATRSIIMPFHHLISKVGFRIFIDDPQPTVQNYVASLNSITITAVKSGFISESNTYTATNAQGLRNGTFSDNTTSDEFILLQHGLYSDLDLRQYLRQSDAYDLCPNYLQQIPQGDVKIRVQLQIKTIDGDNHEETINYDKLLSLNKTTTTGDLFTWEPEKRYIYYLHIPNIHEHEIEYTCEIRSWDEVQTSDIPIEL